MMHSSLHITLYNTGRKITTGIVVLSSFQLMHFGHVLHQAFLVPLLVEIVPSGR